MKGAGELEILGVSFNGKGTYSTHVDKRTSACRRGMFALAPVGMCYPGLHAETKAYLWSSVGAPTLMYGMESIGLSIGDVRQLKTTQGSILKQVLGFGKRYHHSALIDALGIKQIDSILVEATAGLCRRLSAVRSQATDLQIILMSLYYAQGTRIKHTLVDRLLNFNLSPLECFFTKPSIKCNRQNNGLTDSLRFLICHDNFVKINSDEYMLAHLLLKSF